jgi:ABC-2 type transport system ATP-binding protein
MIQVDNLTRYYGEFAALEGVSFQLHEGEIVGLLGLNGAGKSTTLKILAGLLMPSIGSVRVDGVDLLTEPDRVRGAIGFLPEEPPLYRDMTVQAFLEHAGRIKGMSTAAVRERMPSVIATCDLQGREHQVIGTLSHGYKKRVGIAMAIIHRPKLIILDEPISGLDPAQIVEMRRVVRSLAQGAAVIVSSHILSEISQTCDRILVVHGGKLVAQGTEAELVARSGSQHRLQITVRGEAAPFGAWLAAQPQVARCSARDTQPGLASFIVELKADDREALLAALVAKGFGLRLVEAPDDELEEIFLAFTGTEAAA